MIKFGEIRRTYRDRNEIIINDKFAEIILMDIKCNIRGKAMISICNVDKIAPYKWSLNKKGYAMARVGDKSILLHKYLLPVSKGMFVDHINRNKLDCTNENLREATPSENSHNSKIFATNTSGLKGIRLIAKSNKWSVEIMIRGTRYRKSGIVSKTEAIKQLEKFKEVI